VTSRFSAGRFSFLKLPVDIIGPDPLYCRCKAMMRKSKSAGSGERGRRMVRVSSDEPTENLL
jgi:hypothetical protein